MLLVRSGDLAVEAHAIGRGAFGSVYVARSRRSPQLTLTVKSFHDPSQFDIEVFYVFCIVTFFLTLADWNCLCIP
jgi:hypothetical protein